MLAQQEQNSSQHTYTTSICAVVPSRDTSGLGCRHSQPRVWDGGADVLLNTSLWTTEDSGFPSPSPTHHPRAGPELTNLSNPEWFRPTFITCVVGQKGCKNEESKERKTVYRFFHVKLTHLKETFSRPAEGREYNFSQFLETCPNNQTRVFFSALS